MAYPRLCQQVSDVLSLEDLSVTDKVLGQRLSHWCHSLCKPQPTMPIDPIKPPVGSFFAGIGGNTGLCTCDSNELHLLPQCLVTA